MPLPTRPQRYCDRASLVQVISMLVFSRQRSGDIFAYRHKRKITRPGCVYLYACLCQSNEMFKVISLPGAADMNLSMKTKM